MLKVSADLYALSEKFVDDVDDSNGNRYLKSPLFHRSLHEFKIYKKEPAGKKQERSMQPT
jgi:hypothetical protein